MTFVALVTIEINGRRNLLLTATLGQMIFLLLPLPMASIVKSNVNAIFVIISLCCSLSFFAMATGPVTVIYVAEVLPSGVLGAGMGVCVAVHWVSAWIFTSLYARLMSNVFISFGVAAAFCGIGGYVCLTHVRDTTGCPMAESPYSDLQKEQDVGDLLIEELSVAMNRQTDWGYGSLSTTPVWYGGRIRPKHIHHPVS